MIRNFWMKKNAKKFNKCETKCDRNVATKITKRFVIKLKICSILKLFFMHFDWFRRIWKMKFLCWKVLV